MLTVSSQSEPARLPPHPRPRTTFKGEQLQGGVRADPLLRQQRPAGVRQRRRRLIRPTLRTQGQGAGCQEICKGPFTYDVHKVVGMLVPLPPCHVTITQPFSTIICFWVNPPPPSVQTLYVNVS